MKTFGLIRTGKRVALLAEGVDRNLEKGFAENGIFSVALLAEGVDRNTKFTVMENFTKRVALLAEGVDRNFPGNAWWRWLCRSPSSRRAWIEIQLVLECGNRAHVALLAEGVDRNFDRYKACCDEMGRPPRGGRG